LIFEDCPKCGHQVVLSPGKAARCESCGEPLASCEWCGKTLVGPDIAGHVAGAARLCKAHRAEADWESARLREFDTEEALTPPAGTPRALGARDYYEGLVRTVYSRKKDPEEELFPPEKRKHLDPNGEVARGWPERVIEAYRFYERAVMSRDNGTVGVFQWALDGQPLYVVQCDTDGSGGYLELYDADGSALGYARTRLSCPVWTSRAVVRRRAFTGDRDEVDERLVVAERRLGAALP
jgi:ribosomal protein S27E